MTCYARKLKLVDIHGIEHEGIAICPSHGPKTTKALRKAAFEWIRSHAARSRRARGGDFRRSGVNVPFSVATGETRRLKEYVAAHLGIQLPGPLTVEEVARLERAKGAATEQRELKLRQGEPRWMGMLDEALGVKR